jgi:hypothetical protein
MINGISLSLESDSKSISFSNSNKKATNLVDKQTYVISKTLKNDEEQYFEITVEKMSKPNMLIGFLDHELLKKPNFWNNQPYVRNF